LEEVAAEPVHRERPDRGARALRPAAPQPQPPDLRAIADRVYDVLVDRVRHERRTRGF